MRITGRGSSTQRKNPRARQNEAGKDTVCSCSVRSPYRTPLVAVWYGGFGGEPFGGELRAEPLSRTDQTLQQIWPARFAEHISPINGAATIQIEAGTIRLRYISTHLCPFHLILARMDSKISLWTFVLFLP